MGGSVKIQILGTGCPKCVKLTEAVKTAADALGLAYEIEKVSDVNQIMAFFGRDAVDFMTDRQKIRWILMICEAWRSMGWDSIIFYTAIISISPTLYEAAEIDGANRMQIIRNIILPALVVPMITMFILNLGFFLNAGFDQVFNFSNQAVESTIDILDTYIYRIGIEGGQYSLATAVSLIKGVVGVLLVWSTHIFAKRVSGTGVWS